jgi:hypothetical protein
MEPKTAEKPISNRQNYIAGIVNSFSLKKHFFLNFIVSTIAYRFYFSFVHLRSA